MEELSIAQWLASLPREFAFLLALPFLLAIAALVRQWRDNHHNKPRKK